jgi:alpha-beta hydrolase superfamily lysophospholipase
MFALPLFLRQADLLSRYGAALCLLGLSLQLAACTERYQPAGPAVADPDLSDGVLIMSDGERLAARVHRGLGVDAGAVIALHGFNDHGSAWDGPAARWREDGLTVYAIDQRGFGANADPGIWPGVATLVRDLREAVAVARDRHPGKPVFVVGESMGAAVIMTALGAEDALDVDGAVLAAPAVWARPTMTPTVRGALRTMRDMFPGLVLSGSGIRRQASDDIEMLRALGRDPLVIKGTRVDALGGLVDLMDAAYRAAPNIRSRVLVLYGEKDEIVPRRSFEATLARFGDSPDLAIYEDGWHLLFRDLNGPIVQNDVRHWMLNGGSDLPSGADDRAGETLAGLGR